MLRLTTPEAGGRRDPAAGGARRAGDRDLRRVRRGAGGERRPPGGGRRDDPRRAADRGQPRLGRRPRARRRRRRGRGAGDPRRGPRGVPADRRARPRRAPPRAAPADALQHRLARPTGGWGTALGVVYAKAAAGEPVEVLACETRPLLQGARLTAWELQQAGIPVTVLTEGAAAARLARGGVDAVIVGADRVAANGDTANKIGTYALAIAAHHHGVPFYVAVPRSTLDPRNAGRRRDRDRAARRRRGARRRRAAGRGGGVEPGVRRHAGGAGDRDRVRRRRAAAAVRAPRSPARWAATAAA